MPFPEPSLDLRVDLCGSRIRFGLSLRVTLVAIRVQPDVIEVILEVPDRDTGRPIELRFASLRPSRHETSYHAEAENDRERADVRALLQQVLLHELDEQLMVDGRREFDPHHRIKPRQYEVIDR